MGGGGTGSGGVGGEGREVVEERGEDEEERIEILSWTKTPLFFSLRIWGCGVEEGIGGVGRERWLEKEEEMKKRELKFGKGGGVL